MNIQKNKASRFDLSEIYRQLRVNLEFSIFEKKLQVVNITSTNPGEGKSSVASNLGLVSSSKYPTVLIIDCDLRRPTQHKLFGASNSIGLSNLMRNFENFDVLDDSYFQKFKDHNSSGKLYLLTSGSRVPNPQEMLASEKFKKLIEMLRTRFDFIVIDTPPVSAVADAVPVSHVSDGTIFVVSSKDTNKHDAKTALTQLQRNGANVLGCVLTKVESTSSHYNSYYYTSEE